MFKSVSEAAHNEQMKHIASFLNTLGFSLFASGVLANLIENGRSARIDLLVISFVIWLGLFFLSSYILADKIIDLDEELEEYDGI